MFNEKKMKSELLEQLSDALSKETEKPFDEIDFDFVARCGTLIDKLVGNETVGAAEKVEEEAKKLLPNTRISSKQRKPWKIAIAAAAAICMSVTIVAAVPQLRNFVLDTLKLNVGDCIENNGVTYINLGKGKTYSDIEELIKAENLDIPMFDDIENSLKVQTITHLENENRTIITFNDTTSVEIFYNSNNISDDLINASEIKDIGNLTVYLTEKNHHESIDYLAYFYCRNNTYIIKSQSQKNISILLNSINKER